MILAPTLTLNTPAGSPLDADAVAFAAASGATDVAALSDFVKGVKALGLWNNMVCWPLRSSQNAGTGTTAFSLGGLGTFNGTLVNGPTWGADGITTDGTDDNIDATIPTSSQWTVVAIMKRLVADDAEPRYYWGLVYSSQTSTLQGTTYYLKDVGLGVFMFNGASAWSPSRQAVNNSTDFGIQSVAYNETGPSATSSLNGVFTNSSSAPDMSAVRPDRLHIGRRRFDGFCQANAQHAFYAFFNQSISNTSVAAISNLYKTTLGTGLGLP